MANELAARDIQAFEMTPLGPFNGKSLGTSISPWVVTIDALESYKTTAPKQSGIPRFLSGSHSDLSAYSINMEVEIATSKSSTRVANCPVRSLYWTPSQMVAHSVSSGSSLRTGDILATGTISGPGEGNKGCLLETTEGGSRPITLHNGSQRTYLEDWDVVRITAVAGDTISESGVGFGDCVGQLTPSRPF